MGYCTTDNSRIPAAKWGLSNEEAARNSQHTEIEACLTPCQSLLAERIHVQCPYKHSKSSVSDAAQVDTDVYMTEDLTVKTAHRYFTQVCSYRLICMKYNTVTLFTSKEFHITSLNYDNAFSHNLVLAC
ncbi:hypothetical protein ACJMK2_020912 [Sinanodonta woodiana]|uniref:Uncharacterized protein n=1 Tax=Sinanodonta woodiana TaxID=1069815 RepID=A0ABD3U0I5_SINWO